MAFLCNAFNDPSNPWYYVIGVVFLLVIFGALAAYIILTGKKNKSKDGTTDEPKVETDKTADSMEEKSTTVSTDQSDELKQQ